MNYKIPYTVENRVHAPELSQVSLDGTIGARFDRLIYERVSGEFAVDEILREAEDCYRDKYDDEYGVFGLWRGEFWGKLMLSACRVCRYKDSEKLKAAIRVSVYRMLSFQEEDGYLSTYRDRNFVCMSQHESVLRDYGWRSCWNIWSRKYTLWALIECAELLDDAVILNACVRMADQLLRQMQEMGIRIKETGCMDGMPSCSIMKPMLLLYRLTGDGRYLDFCTDIAAEWDRADGERPNLIRNALSGIAPSHWYDRESGWVAKAYEMMSCFDGLCELYRVTGTERYLEACRGLWCLLMKYEANILGSVGYCEHFADGAAYPDAATEACDVIHWMRLCYELFSLTGEACYMEAFENAYLNAFLASVNEDGRGGSFFVRSSGRHWYVMPQCQTKYQHCCLNNVPRGFINAAEASVMESAEGYYINLYTMTTVRFGDTLIRVGDNYTRSGNLTVSVRNPKPGKKLFLRIPSWSTNMKWRSDAEMLPVSDLPQQNGYAVLPLDGDLTLRLQFDMTPRVIDFAGEWRELPEGDYHVRRWSDDTGAPCNRAVMVPHPMAHIRRGPILLARSKRVFGKEEEMFDGVTVFGKERTCTAVPIRHDDLLGVFRVTLTCEGETREYIMCDYASAANRPVEDVRYFTVFV